MAAIYMWPEDKYLLLTTTLYPVDVTESMVLGIAYVAGALELIANDHWSTTFEPSSNGTLTQLRWFYSDGPYEDNWTISFDAPINGTLVQLRWFYTDGPYEDNWTTTFAPADDGILENKLVEADSPDEMLQLGCVILNTCTMDLI